MFEQEVNQAVNSVIGNHEPVVIPGAIHDIKPERDTIRGTYNQHMAIRRVIWPALPDTDYNKYRAEAEDRAISEASRIRADKRHLQQRHLRAFHARRGRA